MNLALLPRAHTTVLANQQFINSFSSRIYSNKLLRVDFYPTFKPRRHNLSLSCARNRTESKSNSFTFKLLKKKKKHTQTCHLPWN